MTHSRRSFLGLLAAAPVALPAVAKAAHEAVVDWHVSRNFKPIFGSTKWTTIDGSEWSFVNSSIRSATIEPLTVSVDTTAYDEFLDRLRNDALSFKWENETMTDGGMYGQLPAHSTDLTRHRLVYLASPYTKYESGLDAAFRDVCAIAAELLREGVKVYSPIAHTHPIAIHGNLDPRNHDIWLPFDQAMMDAADAICVADMWGWRESYGVQYEIETFRRAGKPIYFRSVGGTVDKLP